MNPALLRYFDRAVWAFRNANNDSLPLNAKSHLIAVSLHACQSLKESLEHLTVKCIVSTASEVGAAFVSIYGTEHFADGLDQLFDGSRGNTA